MKLNNAEILHLSLMAANESYNWEEMVEKPTGFYDDKPLAKGSNDHMKPILIFWKRLAAKLKKERVKRYGKEKEANYSNGGFMSDELKKSL